MSRRDLEFIKELEISESELSRLLGISRQALNKGVRSDGDYLNEKKLSKIERELVNHYNKNESFVKKIITKYYPYQYDNYFDYKFDDFEVESIKIKGDIYFICTQLSYFLKHNKSSFHEIRNNLISGVNGDVYFVFKDRANIAYNKMNIKRWLNDSNLLKRCYFFVCPSVELLPFSILGKGLPVGRSKKEKNYVYFLDEDRVFEHPEKYSSYTVNFVKKFAENNRGLIEKMFD